MVLAPPANLEMIRKRSEFDGIPGTETSLPQYFVSTGTRVLSALPAAAGADRLALLATKFAAAPWFDPTFGG